MRDHRKLRAFELADTLVLEIYAETKSYPPEERFGLTFQLRKSAVSTASNVVEGCARSSLPDYIRFLEIAFGSARELEYQLSIAARLNYSVPDVATKLANQADETSRVLFGLIQFLKNSS